jgi:hypothetical protein
MSLAFGLALVLAVSAAWFMYIMMEPREKLRRTGAFLLATQWIVPYLAFTFVSATIDMVVTNGGQSAFYEVAANVIPLLLLVAVLQEGGINLRGLLHDPKRVRRTAQVFFTSPQGNQKDERVAWERDFNEAAFNVMRALPAVLVLLLLTYGETLALLVLAAGRQASTNTLGFVSGCLAAGFAAAIVRVLTGPWDDSTSEASEPKSSTARDARRRSSRVLRSRASRRQRV